MGDSMSLCAHLLADWYVKGRGSVGNAYMYGGCGCVYKIIIVEKMRDDTSFTKNKPF